MHVEIEDPYFRVEIDFDGSSSAPDKSIWRGQHTCVSEGFTFDDKIPVCPSDAIINNQLKVKHWSVLEFGYVVLHFSGFPHDCVMQLVRHQDSKPLVQSMRYTGSRIIEAAKDRTLVEKVFYAPPVGKYFTREGFYEYTEQQRGIYLEDCWQSALRYASFVEAGHPEELARRSLLSGYRQNFSMAGTIRAVFHWLDQRTLTDSQGEAQTLAWMTLEKLKQWQPGLFEYYEKTRAGKNLLAP
jgi:thymidylate synthase (FAD)